MGLPAQDRLDDILKLVLDLFHENAFCALIPGAFRTKHDVLRFHPARFALGHLEQRHALNGPDKRLHAAQRENMLFDRQPIRISRKSSLDPRVVWRDFSDRLRSRGEHPGHDGRRRKFRFRIAFEAHNSDDRHIFSNAVQQTNEPCQQQQRQIHVKQTV